MANRPNEELTRRAQEAREAQKNSTKIVIESMSLLTAGDAVAFYKSQCQEHEVKPNNTFIRQLSGEAELSVINFSNSYFGDRGMAAIAPVLGKIPVIALDLRNTGFSAGDAASLSESMVRHPTLTSVDLRSNVLSVPATRRLLSLLTQNKRITSIQLDDETPKRLLIEKQCVSNSDVCLYSSCCLVCLRTMQYDEAHYAESHLISRLWERLGARAGTLVPVEMQVMCEAVLACLDLNDGVLFLCSHECIESLVDDLILACNVVTRASNPGSARTSPKHQAIYRCAMQIIKASDAALEQARRDSIEASSEVAVLPKAPSGTMEATAFQRSRQGESGVTETARLLERQKQERRAEEDARELRKRVAVPGSAGAPTDSEAWVPCSVCGTMCMALAENTTALMFRILHRDVGLMVKKRAQLRPSAFSRLIQRFLADVAPRVCTVKCLRAHVRFGITGFGGALRPLPSSDEHHIHELLSTQVPRDEVDFGCIDFTRAHHYDHPEEDTTCALAVASTLSDMEGVRMDPYFLYAAAKHLSKSTPEHFGLELRKVMEAACVMGCLPADEAPYQPMSPRGDWADWETNWCARDDFPRLRRIAIARAKSRYFSVHKPGGNLFDEVRAAMWSTRGLRRGLIGVMKWRSEWFACPGGIIPTEKMTGGFYVAVKILGQCRLEDGVVRLVLQPMMGADIGRNGFFFASRTVANRGLKFGAFMFLEPESIRALAGNDTFASKSTRVLNMVPSRVRKVLHARTAAYGILELLAEPRCIRRDDIDNFAPFLESLPTAMSFALFVTDGPGAAPEHHRQLQHMRALFAMDAVTQLAFFFAQPLPTIAARYFAANVDQAQQINLSPHAAHQLQALRSNLAASYRDGGESNPGSPLGHSVVGRKFDELEETTGPAAPAGAFSKKIGRKVPQAPMQAPPKGKPGSRAGARTSSRSSKKNEPPPLIDDAALESHRALMEEVAANVERDRTRALKLSEISRRRTAHSWLPPAHLRGPDVAGSGSDAPAAVNGFTAPAAEVMQMTTRGWQAVRLPETFHVIFFHGRCVSVVDYSDDEGPAVVLLPPTPMKLVPAFERFPFRNGFDAAAVCSTVSSEVVYVFAQGYWVQWDLVRNSCVAGPFELSVHATFRCLPDQFLRHSPGRSVIKSVLDIPGQPWLAFCAAHTYAVVDVEQRSLVGQYTFGGVSDIGPLGKLGATEGDHTPIASLPGFVTSEADSIEGCDDSTLLFPNGDILTRHGDRVSTISEALAGAPLEHRLASTSGAVALLRLLSTRAATGLLASVSLYQPPAWEHAARAPTGVAPAVLPGGLSASTVPVVTSSLPLTDLDAAPSDLLRPLSPAEGDNLWRRAVFVATADADRAGEHARATVSGSIGFDFGAAAHCRFGYLQIVLALDGPVGTPITAHVECSWDGVAYRIVTTASVSAGVADVKWGATHGSRYWRLRFVHLPCTARVVRTLWHVASWSVESRPFNAFASYAPLPGHAVAVEAARVLCPPAAILRPINAASVFRIPPAPCRYRAPHCVIPLLQPATTALMIAGTSFVEWDFKTNSLASKETCNFATHPGFRDLPFPFDHGVDAAFYPDPIHSRSVVLISGGLAIEWRLDHGNAAGPAVPLGQSPWLAGVPPPFCDGVDAAVNLWDRPGQIVLFHGDQTLTWYVAELQLVDPPVPRRDRLHLYAPAYDGKHLLSATTVPAVPGRLMLFCDETYSVVDSTRDRHVSSVLNDAPIVGSPAWPNLTWFLDWGVTRKETVVTFDFGVDCPLMAGITLHMSLPSGSSVFEPSVWRVDASSDGKTWRTVCSEHRQDALSCTARWPLPFIGWRYYRLSLLSSQATQEQHMLQTRFHALRSSRLMISPVSMRTTGKVLGGGDAAAAGSMRRIQFPGTVSASVPGITIFDFGDLAELELVAITIRQAEPSDQKAIPSAKPLQTPSRLEASLTTPCPTTWSVMWSDDGANWQSAGKWKTRGASARLSWAPCLPHRFWRVDLEGCNIAAPTPVFEGFTFEEYAGIAVIPPLGRQYHEGLSLLCPTAWRTGDIGVDVPGAKGQELVFDCKGQPQAFVGVTIAADVESSAFTTRFNVEYSEDGSSWFAVGDVVVSKDTATAVWESEGAYRFWRLVVAGHYGAREVRIISVDWSDSGPALYMRQRRHVDRISPTTFRAKTRAQSEFVSVRARVPAGTTWVVEHASQASMEWAAVGVAENTSHKAAFVTASWPLQSSSVHWRLRPSADDVDPASATDVQWYSFCGTAAHVVDARNANAEVAVQNFTVAEGKAPSDLCDTDNRTPVVCSAPPEPVKPVTPVPTAADDDPPPQSTGDAKPERDEMTSDALFLDPTALPLAALPPAGASDYSASVEYSWPRPARLTAVEVSVAALDQSKSGSTNAGWTVGDVVVTVEQVDADGSVVSRPLGSMLLCDDVEILSWGNSNFHAARRWRLRFSIRGGARIGIRGISWFFDHGAVAPVIDRWRPAVSNELMAEATRGRDRTPTAAVSANFTTAMPVASAHFSSALPVEELPPLDAYSALALECFRSQKQVQKRVTKLLKSNKRNAGNSNSAPPVSLRQVLELWAGEQATYVHEFLGDDVILSELKLAKESQSWTLPKTEYRGNLQRPLFNITGCNISLGIRWRLDEELTEEVAGRVNAHTDIPCHIASLRGSAAGTGPVIPEDWAALTVVVDITNRDWIPTAHFPGIAPLLVEAGAAGRQLVTVVAGTRITFSKDQPLTLPNSVQPVSPAHPMTLNRGVNLVFELQTKRCSSLEVAMLSLFGAKSPAPPVSKTASPTATPATAAVIDEPRPVTPSKTPPRSPRAAAKPVAAAGPAAGELWTTAVIHMDSANATAGHLRFTADIDTSLGFPGVLKTHSATFEINAECDPKATFRALSFATLESTISLGPSGSSFPVAIVGHVTSQGSPRVVFDGSAPTARWAEPAGIADSLLDSIKLRGIAVPVGESFAGMSLHVSGTLRLLNEHLTVPATANVSLDQHAAPDGSGLVAGAQSTRVETLQVELHELRLDEFMALARGICGVDFPESNAAWMSTAAITVSGILDVVVSAPESTANAASRHASLEAGGSGALHFADAVGNATMSIGPGGVSITATMPRLLVSGLTVVPTSGNCIVLEFFAPPDGPPFARVEGGVALLTEEPVPCSVEIAADGVLVRTQGAFVDAYARSSSVTSPMARANVTFVVDEFKPVIARKLQRTPMLTSLCSAGVPFTFDLHAITAGAADVRRHTFVMALRGMLLGSSYTVHVPVTNLRFNADFIEEVAEHAALAILEQSTEAAWPLVSEFVLGQEAQQAEPATDEFDDIGGNVGSDDSSDDIGVTSVREQSYPPSSFLARWSAEAEELINEAAESAIDIM